MNQLSHQYGTYEKQLELLNMIIEIDKLFSANGIVYSLCGGTLLGAIRENGFIPWDDDIDIMVDRNNYSKILSLFQHFDNGSDYVLNRNLWIYRIQKRGDEREGIYAATIDVFVMDNCPDDPIIRNMKVLFIKILQGMMKEEQNYDDQSSFYKACLWITHLLGKCFNDETKFNWYQAVSKIGNNKKTKFITGYNDLFKTLKLRYPSNLFESIEQHCFEHTHLPVTSEYDAYLRTQYGDYMTPPGEKDRIPIHTL